MKLMVKDIVNFSSSSINERNKLKKESEEENKNEFVSENIKIAVDILKNISIDYLAFQAFLN